jgi:hypothetical protein
MVSAQTPLHTMVPAGHTHWPEVQLAPTAHTCDCCAVVQPPQLLVSLETSTQPVWPAQFTRPVPQVQTPATQLAPVPQTLPQVPQLKLSFCLSTHWPLQMLGVAAGQEHWPEVHVPPIGQGMSQPPQLATSLEMSKQPVAQVVLPTGQVQLPPAHTAPGLQAWPQLPQFPTSIMVSVQTEPHRFGMPDGQVHWPAMQLAPTGHAWPQVPQLLASPCVLVQVPLQLSGSVPPHGTHWPAAHISPVLQA